MQLGQITGEAPQGSAPGDQLGAGKEGVGGRARDPAALDPQPYQPSESAKEKRGDGDEGDPEESVGGPGGVVPEESAGAGGGASVGRCRRPEKNADKGVGVRCVAGFHAAPHRGIEWISPSALPSEGGVVL